MKKSIVIALVVTGVVASAGAATAIILTAPQQEHVCVASDWIVDSAPSCTEDGQKHKACVSCGQILETATIDALGHEYSDWIVDQEATYTQTGLQHKECTRCGEVLLSEGIPMIGHTCTFEEWVILVQPTCTEEGKHRHTCSTCGLIQEEVMPKLGHDFICHEANEPDCIHEGNHKYWSCSRCHKDFSNSSGSVQITNSQIVISALGHQMTHVDAVAATCLDSGKRDYWCCDRCHDCFADEEGASPLQEEDLETAALGHILAHHTAVAATCTTAGNIEYWFCSRCQRYYSDAECQHEITKQQTVLAALGHLAGQTTAVKPTCTESGNTEYWYCITCRKYFSDSDCTNEISLADTIVAALGHDGVHHEAVASTCVQNGICEYWSCSRCNALFSNSNCTQKILQFQTTVSSLGHHYQNGECTHCHASEPALYTINDSGVVTFGSYPQSRVTNSSLLTTLNFLGGTLPKLGVQSAGGWVSYSYFIENQVEHYMWYKDVNCDDGRYRGVYFVSYRPSWTNASSSKYFSFQDENGYETGNVYWYKWEPLTWTQIRTGETYSLLLCNYMIDAQEWSSSTPLDYESSSIRAWLNNEFYSSAFSASQKAIIPSTSVDNSLSSIIPRGQTTTQTYICNNTLDKVFLLSSAELTSEDMQFAAGMTADARRAKKPTDYALVQGHNVKDAFNHDVNNWWTRSVSYMSSQSIAQIDYRGRLSGYCDSNITSLGVVPALWLTK